MKKRSWIVCMIAMTLFAVSTLEASAKKDDISGLIFRTAEICGSLSHSTDDCEALQDVGEMLNLPSLVELSTLRRERRLDIRDSIFILAASDLLTFAEERYGTASSEAVWCRYIATDALSNAHPETSWKLAKDNVNYAQSLASKYPKDRKARVLCLLAQAEEIACANNLEIDNPLSWNEIFRIEQECHEIYGNNNNNEATDERRALYFTLAMAKNNGSTFSAFLGYLGEKFFPNGFPRPGLNDQCGLFNNSEAYLSEALEMSKKMYGDDNIRTLLLKVAILQTKIQIFGIEATEDLYNQLKQLHNEAKRHFAPGDVIPFRIECLMWECDLREHKRLDETSIYRVRLMEIEKIYGKYSPFYFNNLFNIMLMRMQVNAMQAKMLAEEMEEIADRIFPEHSPMKHIANLWLIGIHQNNDTPEVFQQYIEKLKTDYVQYHQPSWMSIWYGRRLSNLLKEDLQRYDEALTIWEISLNDLKVLSSDTSLLYAVSLTEQCVIMINTTQSERTERTILQAMDLMRQHGISDNSLPLLLSDLYYNNNRLKEAESVLREGIERCKAQDPWKTYLRIELAEVLMRDLEKNRTEIDGLMETAIPVFLDTLNNISASFFRGYETICAYYDIHKRYADEERVLLNAKQTHETYVAQYDDALLSIIKGLFSIYAFQYDDFDKAERFIDGYVEDIRSNPSFTSHHVLLELLTLHNEMLKIKAPTDWVRRMHLLQEMSNECQIIYNSYGLSASGNEMAAVRLYLPIMDEYASAFSFFSQWGAWVLNSKRESERMPDSPAKKEFTDLLEMGKKTYDTTIQAIRIQLIPIIEQIKTIIEENTDQFMDSQEYYIACRCEGSFYYCFEKDSNKFRQMMTQFVKCDNIASRLNALWNLADLENNERNFAESVRWREEYLRQIRDNKVDLSLTTQAQQQSQLFASYYMSGRYNEALHPAWEFRRLRKQIANKNFELMTQSERENFFMDGATGGSPLQWLLPHFSELSGEGYDFQLEIKGLLLRTTERTRKAILHSGDIELIASLDSLDALNAQYKQIEQYSFSNGTYTASEESLRIRNQIEHLEREINRRSTQYVDQTDTIPHWQDVRNALGDGEAAIEFMLTDSATCALILRNSFSQPHFVHLTETRPLLEGMDAMQDLSSKRRAELMYESDSLHLFERLWQPLEKELRGVSRVYFSPTAYLNSLAFAAFRTPNGTPLMDRYELHQLLSTASLLHRDSIARKPILTAALIGSVFYSPEQAVLAQKEMSDADMPQTGERGAIIDDDEEFGYLPFTRSEIRGAQAILKNANVNVRTLEGFEPTERAMSTLSESNPDILHLSTHGFFIAKEEHVQTNKFLARFPGNKSHSMQRAGMALTDANAAWRGEDLPEENDGILTANEIALMNLRHTRLAVLSACQTAAGLYSMDGVYGVHRGFRQAGVRSIMATLWNVNDESTSVMMDFFYQRWLNGVPMQQAFQQSIQELRTRYSSPYFWAPFVLYDADL